MRIPEHFLGSPVTNYAPTKSGIVMTRELQTLIFVARVERWLSIKYKLGWVVGQQQQYDTKMPPKRYYKIFQVLKRCTDLVNIIFDVRRHSVSTNKIIKLKLSFSVMFCTCFASATTIKSGIKSSVLIQMHQASKSSKPTIDIE